MTEDESRALFGTDTPPAIDLDVARLHTLALATVGKTTMSGVQRKISMGLSTDRQTLRVAVEGAHYILKPTSQTFPSLPENEATAMRIARRCGVRTAPFGLVTLTDGSRAYVVRRFDRLEDGAKLRQEDFCQLSLRSAKDKYNGSAELCVRVVRKYASEPVTELTRLLRRILVSWLIGDGDLHLKNLSLLTESDARHRLSPAYDLVCTRLYIPDDRMALPIGGRDEGLTRRSFLELGRYAGLPKRSVERILESLRERREDAVATVQRSELPAEMSDSLAELVNKRFGAL